MKSTVSEQRLMCKFLPISKVIPLSKRTLCSKVIVIVIPSANRFNITNKIQNENKERIKQTDLALGGDRYV